MITNPGPGNPDPQSQSDTDTQSGDNTAVEQASQEESAKSATRTTVDTTPRTSAPPSPKSK